MTVDIYREIFERFNSNNNVLRYTNWNNINTTFNLLTHNWNSIFNIGPNSDNIHFNSIKIYNGQVNRTLIGLMKAPLTPACYVEIEEINSNQLGNCITASDLIVKFHIVSTQLDSSDGNLDQNISVFKLRDTIKRWFNGFKISTGGKFIYLDEDEDYDHEIVYHYILVYKCHNFDFVGQIEYLPYRDDILVNTIWNAEYSMWNNINNNWNNLTNISGPLNLDINIVLENN